MPTEEAEDSEETEDEKLGRIAALLTRYAHKVAAEREARLSGAIAAADFYVRQLTFIEVMLDLGSEGRGWELLEKARGGVDLCTIADTFMSRLLDEQRRLAWAQLGEPERPAPPPDERLTDRGDFRFDCSESWTSGDGRSVGDWQRDLHARRTADAAAQIEWEMKARAAAAAWRRRLEAEDTEGEVEESEADGEASDGAAPGPEDDPR